MKSVTTTITYRVETFQEGDRWVARVLGLDADYTHARTFKEVEAMARDLVAPVLDVEEAEVGTIHVVEGYRREPSVSTDQAYALAPDPSG